MKKPEGRQPSMAQGPWLKDGLLALLLVLGVLTWRQCGRYADVETLWRTTVARNPDACLAYNNLGYILLQKGRVNLTQSNLATW